MSWPRTCSVCATGSASSGGVFDLTGLRARLEELNAEISRPDLWDDREKAEKTSREKTSLERELSLFDELESSLDDAATLLELAEEADDNEARGEAAEHFRGVEDVLEAAEMRQLLGGEHDRGDGLSGGKTLFVCPRRDFLVPQRDADLGPFEKHFVVLGIHSREQHHLVPFPSRRAQLAAAGTAPIEILLHRYP